MSEIKLNNDQGAALIAMERGDNVFITGCGGTGKSVIIREFVDRTEKNVIVCAPTGKAAINVGGITVHKLILPPARLVAPYMMPSDDNELMDAADVIIVDEVSMLRIDTFEYLVRTMRASEERTGRSKQLVVIGDMHQLPPVITTSDRELLQTYWGDVREGFAFRSKEWKDCNFTNIVLREQMRQSDEEYIHNLELLRMGSTECIDFFNNKTAKHRMSGVTLCSRKSYAATINNELLVQLPGEPKIYTALIDGDFPAPYKMTSDYIMLKPGARVITLYNDPEGLFQNGSTGTVKNVYDEVVEVTLDTGRDVVIGYYTWFNDQMEVTENGKLVSTPVGSFSQIPLTLGYALTIHKSQGMTLTAANIIPECFAPGQLYVAMSRVKTAAGIYIDGEIRAEDVMASPDVTEFYNSLVFENVSPSIVLDKRALLQSIHGIEAAEYDSIVEYAEEFICEYLRITEMSLEEYVVEKAAEKVNSTEEITRKILETERLL